MKRIKFIMISFLAVLFTIYSLPVYQLAKAADEQVPPGIEKQGRIPGKGKHKGWEKGKHKGWEKAKEEEKKDKAEKESKETKGKSGKTGEEIKKTTEKNAERTSPRTEGRGKGAGHMGGGKGHR